VNFAPITVEGKRLNEVEGQRSLISRQARRYRIYASLALVDTLALFVGFELAGALRHTRPFGDGFTLALMIAPAFLLFAINGGAYGFAALSDWRTGLGRALFAMVQALALVLFIAFSVQATDEFSRVVFGVGAGAGLGLMVAGRWGMSRLVRARLGTHLRSELVILDGAAIPPVPGAQMVDAGAAGLRPDPRDPMMLHLLGSLVRGADYVLVASRPEDRAAWAHLLKGTDVPAHVVAPEFDEVGATRLGRYHGVPTMQVSTGVLDLRDRLVKRALDLAVTVPVIVALTPLLGLVALAIKLDSPGPVFFTQQRLGRGNRLFRMFKFRSMRTETCDADGNQSTQRGDARITRVGRLIRATSIDELPQLFNVLHGDMSLVGPRPHALGSLAGLELFWDVDQRYWHRHALKPGITGLAQVRGHRGATLKRDDLINRLKADLEYFQGWTLWRDIGILAATLKVVVHRNAF